MTPTRTTLLFEQWPTRDQSLWNAANVRGGFLEADGPAAAWTGKTRTGVMKRYGMWLGFLSSNGALATDICPSERVSEELLVAYVRWLQAKGNASTTLTSCVRDLWEAIRVMEPGSDQSLLRELTITLHARQAPTRNKHTRIIHPDALLKSALTYLDNIADLDVRGEFCRAGKFRDALVIAFLACRPIRLANLTGIILSDHLVEDDGIWRCAFGGHETKDKRPLEFSLPDLLVPYIKTYLEDYRPILLKRNHSLYLWISSRGTPMSEQAVYWNTSRLTEQLYGRRVNPHLFRDCAASALATDDPQHILAIARILGHASIKTSNDHYNQSQMTAAGDILHEVIAGLKQPEAGT